MSRSSSSPNSEAPLRWKDLLLFCNPAVLAAGRPMFRVSPELLSCPAVLPALSEHRLAPLAYRQLKGAGLSSSPELEFMLQGEVVESRHANSMRMQALEELLDAAGSAHIELLILKGAALANLVYPEPGLRPMKDLDVLVRSSQLKATSRLLQRLGYSQMKPSLQRQVKHIPVFTREENGTLVAIELHYDLFDDFWTPSCPWEKLGSDRTRFRIGSIEGVALGPELLMWHTWRHLLEEDTVCLVWLADLFATAEAYEAVIDWESLRRKFPGMLSLLDMTAAVIPISTNLRQRLRPGSLPLPSNLDSFQLAGWPRTRLSDWGGRTVSFLLHTFWPSRAWAAIFYGESRDADVFLNRSVRHSAQLLQWALKRAFIRLERACSRAQRLTGQLSE